MVNFTWCRFAVGSVSPVTARDAKPIVACNIGIRGYCNSLNFHGSDPALFLAREHTEFAGVAKRLRLFFGYAQEHLFLLKLIVAPRRMRIGLLLESPD